MLFCLAPAAKAAAGSVAGYYYYTDIKTYLFGTPVNAINIGGETLIDAEAMAHYGFTVTWHSRARWLEIRDNGVHTVDSTAKSGALLDMASGKSGNIAGKYYYTDIETTVETAAGYALIQSYNIGGRTFIGAEQLLGFGFNVTWKPDARTLTIEPGSGAAPQYSLWTLPVTEGVEDGSLGTVDQFWLTAEKNVSYGQISGLSSYGLSALTGVNLSRGIDGRVTLSFCTYDGSTQKISAALSDKLDGVCAERLPAYMRDPATLSGGLNALLSVYLNGVRVQLKELEEKYTENRIVYTLSLDADAGLLPTNVYSVALLCNVPAGTAVTLPPDTSGMTPYEVALSRLESNFAVTGGSILWKGETDDCVVVYGTMTPPHGSTAVLMLIDKRDATSVSLLGQTGLASIWGVHPALSGLSISQDGTSLYFSSEKNGVTYHFQTDLPSGTTRQISG